MPDSKITALTSISTSTDPANDPLVIVDVSDTSMAATGTTKKVTLNQLLGASGTATLASATITGNLTVQTNKLFVSAGGAAVGTTSIFADFQVQRSTNARLEIDSAAASLSYQVLDNARTGYLQHNVYASQHLWFNGLTEAMRLNSTGLGVGVSPAFKLSAAGVSQFYAESDGIYASGNLSPDLYTIGVNYYNAAGTEGVKVSARPSWKIEHKNSSDALAYLDIGFRAASAAASAFTSRFKIDGSGNVVSNVTGTAPTLATNSQMVFNLTSNTNLRISVRGTDGVTRTANITLA